MAMKYLITGGAACAIPGTASSSSNPVGVLASSILGSSSKAQVGKAGGGGEGELDHHVVGATIGGTGEDEVEGGGDEDAREEEERLGDHCVPSIGLVDAHPPEAGLEAPELVVNTREAAWVRWQQQLGVAGGRFHNDASSRY
ncbi:hypothetical protein B296_00004396 [Ensete ventricosum]|uniref:Uncharacterized protein n=1 Tax=Ensete ventricosum TaxID=4639 RepID=A0A427ATR1_ENSVE|nr:hypothetical protein B296_00004396 [Ensete ventricosum]